MTVAHPIFISHSTADDKDIDQLAHLLEKAGFPTWVDHRKGIMPGDQDWEAKIRQALSDCRCVIFVMTQNAIDSKFCKKECSRADFLGKDIYVLRREVIKSPNDIWLHLEGIQYADSSTDFEVGVQQLIDALNGITGADLPAPVRGRITGGGVMRLRLPYLQNPLRGRDDDVRTIQEMLGEGVAQILGTGGLGKSRIAAEIALNHPNGAVWHRCSAVSQSVDMLALLRVHLRLPEDTPMVNVLASLTSSPPLIVIDNAEDVTVPERRADYVAFVAELRDRGVPVLLTARKVWDEFKPRKYHTPPALNLEIGAGIALDFARSDGITLTDEQATQIAESARLHPRLIEFAVGQLNHRDFERIIRQLTEIKHRDVKEALDEMILKTVRQMTETDNDEAERILRRLTILQGMFTLVAACALAPDGMDDEDDVDDALVILQRWQFVKRDAATKRYSLAELVREALGVPDDEALFNAYADFFIARADKVYGELHDKPEEWSAYTDDLPDITALGDALMMRTQNGMAGDLDRAVAFVVATYNYVGRRMEAKKWTWLDMGLNAARALQTDDPNNEMWLRHESLFLNELGLVWNALGEKRRALAYYEQTLPLSRKLDDRDGDAATLNNIGMVWDALGEKHKALEFYEGALSLSRKLGDRGGEATTLSNIGNALISLGETRKSLAYHEQALKLRQQVGDKGGEGTSLLSIGRAWDAMGENHRALEFYEEALSLFRRVGDRGGEAATLNTIGGTWSALGEKHKALGFYDHALSLFRAVGDRGGEAAVLNNIGMVWSELGEKRKVLEYCEQALLLSRAIDDRGGEATALNNIGLAWQQLGKKRKALGFFEEALSLYRTIGDRGGEAATLFNMSFLVDNTQEAIDMVQQAYDLLVAIDSPHAQQRAAPRLAQLRSMK